MHLLAMASMQEFTASLKGEFTDEQAQALQAFNQSLISEYRAKAGQVEGDFAGAPLLLLTTTGAKSGQPRTTPLVYGHTGEHYFIVASKAGLDSHPAWYHNLKANPEATLEIKGETHKVRARFTEGEERSRLYAQMAAAMPAFNDYQAKTDREIPVVVMEAI